jgi:hypothetical protein
MSALELFSQCARFLHLFGALTDYAPREFSLLFSVREGERCFTRAVHRVGHSHVHLADLVSHSKMKKFGAAHCRFWARLGRVLGWKEVRLHTFTI